MALKWGCLTLCRLLYGNLNVSSSSSSYMGCLPLFFLACSLLNSSLAVESLRLALGRSRSYSASYSWEPSWGYYKMALAPCWFGFSGGFSYGICCCAGTFSRWESHSLGQSLISHSISTSLKINNVGSTCFLGSLSGCKMMSWCAAWNWRNGYFAVVAGVSRYCGCTIFQSLSPCRKNIIMASFLCLLSLWSQRFW